MLRLRVVWLVVSLAACRDVDEPFSVERSAIVGGSEAGIDQRAVVRMSTGCSATVVAPNLLLTARHCVAALPAGSFFCNERGEALDGGLAPQYGALIDPARIMLAANGSSTNPALPDAPTSPRGSAILVPAETSRCRSDIALVVLEPAIDDPVIAPLQLERAAVVGDAITAVGWGLTEDAATLRSPRRREVTVLAVGPATGATPDDTVWPNFFAVSQGPCYGDSGSPARSASGAVVGVASYINFPTSPTGAARDCASAGATGGYAALVPEKEFLTAGFQRAGATPWLEGTPNPRDALLAFGASCTLDAECQSNACAPMSDGSRSCTHGCANTVVATPCPEQYSCQLVEQRERCVKAVVPDAGADVNEPEAAGCSASASSIGGLLCVLVALFRRRES